MQDFFNDDCMEGMKQYPDKYFDLAIVDPPYGGGSQTVQVEREREREKDFAADTQTGNIKNGRGSVGCLTSMISATRTGGTWAAKYQTEGIFSEDIRHWDIAPPKEYFDELARVSKNQIIWGGNYFDLPPTRCFLIFRKKQIPLEGFSMSPVEYAWTSFNDNAQMFEAYSNGGSGREERFHPTQKPVALYEWILRKYAKQGDKILDTHVGSASSLIACENMGFEYVGFEIYKPYYDKGVERLEKNRRQIKLF